MASTAQIQTQVADGDRISVDKKTPAADDAAVRTSIEAGDVENVSEKTYYSKLSVWLMVIFSGLAIGSDG